MQKEIELKPFQDKFIYSDEMYPCFAGGWGSGKTMALCAKMYKAAIEYPNNRLLIGRKHFTDLRDSTIKDFMELFKDYVDMNQANYTAKFKNGSEILFRHLDKPEGITNLNLGGFGIDQAEEITETNFFDLVGRLRKKGMKRFGALVCNTEGHNWIWKKWKQNPKKGYYLVESTTLDNADNLDKQYIENVLALPESIKGRYVFNSWESFEGLIYSELNESVHRIDGFEIPKEWQRIEIMDHGLINPTAWLWAAIDFDGNMYIYDEYYKTQTVVEEHAQVVKEKRADSIFGGRNQHINQSLADPSIFSKTREKHNKPYSVAEEYEENGIFLQPADNTLIAGINKVKQFLSYKLDKEGHYIDRPQLFFFKNCSNLWNEMVNYQWQRIKTGLKEQPMDKDNHGCDDIRYLCNSRPRPTEKIVKTDKPEIWKTIEGRRGVVSDRREGVFEAPREDEIQTLDNI